MDDLEAEARPRAGERHEMGRAVDQRRPKRDGNRVGGRKGMHGRDSGLRRSQGSRRVEMLVKILTSALNAVSQRSWQPPENCRCR